MATEKQPFLVILSTTTENVYPKYIKLCLLPTDRKAYIDNFISKKVIISKERILNTDGKASFLSLEKKITLQSEKIVYKEKEHRMHWLNTIVGNIKNHIVGIYHGIPKRSLPLFLQGQEWRFNHR